MSRMETEAEILELDEVHGDGYEWLELDKIPEHVYNPLLDFPIGKAQEDPIDEIMGHMLNPDYLHFTAKVLLNIELLPFQCVIIDTLWRRRLPMLIASRGAGKSFILAVYALLRMVLHPGCKIAIVGAGFRQSKAVFDYMVSIWEKAPILRDIAGNHKTVGPRREVDKCQFNIGDSMCYAIPIGDGCLSASTLITYEDRFGTISDHVSKTLDGSTSIVNRSIGVWGNGKFRISDEAYYNGKKATKILSSKKGYHFESTHNHKMRVLRSGKVEWVRADQILVGDHVLIDRSYRWHKGYIKENIDECYALGAMIGGGCWTQKDRLSFATRDPEIIDILNRGGFSNNFIQENDKVHWRLQGYEHRMDWIKKWDLEENCYTINKILPKKILSASRQQMTACLQGLFDTNGSVQVAHDKRGGTSVSVTLWNTSEKLIDQVHYILLHYGIVSTKRGRDRTNANWNTEFSLQLSGRNAKLFYEQIGFRLLRKQRLLLEGLSYKSRDVATDDVVPGIMSELYRIAHKYEDQFKGSHRVSSSCILQRKEASRQLIDQFLTRYGSCGDQFIEQLKVIADSNIYYDKIVAVNNGECDTYDIHVPEDHEYCANGFFSHNTKIRGLRANYILADEFASIPEEIFNVVVSGFGVVAAAPVEKVKEAALVKKLRAMGIWSAELEAIRRQRMGGNQIVRSGTAYYSFNHFYKTFQQWHSIIRSKGEQNKIDDIFGDDKEAQKGFDWTDYAILRIPYTKVPEGLMDQGILAQAKTHLHNSQFLMEYGAVFASDSDGFYKRSVIEAATTNRPILVSSGQQVQFSAARHGDKQRVYVMGVDPAADQDNAAIVVLEMHLDHRRVVHCWTTNRKRFTKLKRYMAEKGIEVEENYYAYIAKKIRSLMRVFNIEHIVMDKHGGGSAIQESLASEATCGIGEKPVYPIIDPEDPKPYDLDEGLHILELLAPTSEINSEANHGMLKDIQGKILLFPMFDSVELEKAIQLDNLNDIKFDTYEDLVNEIEELKNEMATIVLTPSSTLGRETFDTPEIKSEGMKKGRLRKDRYSALLYANYYARNKGKDEGLQLEYKPVGGTKNTVKTETTVKRDQGMYHGPGLLAIKGNNKWAFNPGFRFFKNK